MLFKNREILEKKKAHDHGGLIATKSVDDLNQVPKLPVADNKFSPQAARLVAETLSTKRLGPKNSAPLSDFALPNLTALPIGLVDRLRAISSENFKQKGKRDFEHNRDQTSQEEVKPAHKDFLQFSSQSPPRLVLSAETQVHTPTTSTTNLKSRRGVTPQTSPSISKSGKLCLPEPVGLEPHDSAKANDHPIGNTASQVSSSPVRTESFPPVKMSGNVNNPLQDSFSHTDVSSGVAKKRHDRGRLASTRDDSDIVQTLMPESLGGMPATSPIRHSTIFSFPPHAPVRSQELENETLDARSEEVTSASRTAKGIGGQQMSFDAPSSNPTSSHLSQSLVRNPLSADLGNQFCLNPMTTAEHAPFGNSGGFGQNSGVDSFREASSQHEGASVDLSKTNELLQQLVDAVRKQWITGLPEGGPPTYATR